MEKRFHLITGNRLEVLVEKLADLIKHPIASPLDPELVVVQSRGMARWVSLRLAEILGICANVSFPFPNTCLYDLFRRVFPHIPDKTSFSPEQMAWRIMALLPKCLDDPQFEIIRSYLGEKIDQLKLFQLSQTIAILFDRYLIYRPEMILRWDRGEYTEWQPILWRRLTDQIKEIHPAALAQNFMKVVRDGSFQPRCFPERLFIFGISVLPRFHIQLFDAVSQHCSIHMFLMNPCQEYWGNIPSKREWSGRNIQLKLFSASDPGWVYGEGTNSLLSSMGIIGRDFFDMTMDYVDPEDCFCDPGEESLLQIIQSDILHLTDRGSQETVEIEETDDSIQIHSCHSPMREMEVLHDRLLDILDRYPNLLPSDIVVMMPDIETYSPYIQAVFDMPGNDVRKIPFHIADRGVRQESRLIDAFLEIIDLSRKRLTAPEVFSVLETPFIASKFNISEPDLMIIRRWIQDVRIRWGADADHKGYQGFPKFKENTWEAGLERLLLGYALPAQEKRLFAGVLPYDYIEGDHAVLLGSLLDFINRLFLFVRSIGGRKRRTLSEWSDILKQIPDNFFQIEDHAETEIKMLREAINDLAEVQRVCGIDQLFDLDVIQYYLTVHFKTHGFGFGFLSGGITFCAMLPMRSIPFKVVCLAGMNGDAYPRTTKAVSFDLMAKYPQKGDRSRRNDDRYLFLESILSARQLLYISYVGQGIRDNSVIPPSVLVSELMDYIEKGFKVKGNSSIIDHILVKHRLQAFSPDYFKESEGEKNKLFSYSSENLQTAQQLINSRIPYQPFMTSDFSELPAEYLQVSIKDLSRFFSHPCRYLLNQRWGIFLDETDPTIQDTESFQVDGLDRYQLEQDMLAWRLAHQDLNDFFQIAKAGGRLPHGSIGEYLYQDMTRRINEFASVMEGFIQSNLLKPIELDFKLGEFRITGSINPIFDKYLLYYRCAKIRPKDHIWLWLHHLVMNYMGENPYPKTSILAGYDEKRKVSGWKYAPVPDCRSILEILLDYYREGLHRPLHFFPKSSMEYAKYRLIKNTSPDEAMNRAQSVWNGNQYSSGEKSDSYYQLCFNQTDPIDKTFETISCEIWRPLFTNQREVAI